MKTKKATISVFFLAMLNVAVVMSLRGLPIMAKEGLSSVFFLLFSTIFFVLPTSLISAELATGWSEGGGVYTWVKEAFGDHFGFIAIWLQWIQNVIWYPSVLAFAAGTLSYLFLDPELANNKIFNVVIILGTYWIATLINLKGIKASGIFTSIAVITGTILPGLFIIILGILWFIKGEAIYLDNQFFPDFTDFSKVSFLAGVVLLFAGMEVSAVHANSVKNPRKDYPKAIFLATLIVLIVFSLGELSIAVVIPKMDISLTAGIMQAFHAFLKFYKLDFLLPIIGFFIAFGTIGGVAAWIVGPSKGLFATSKYGDIPPFLAKRNKYEVPYNILLIQGMIVTVLSLLYLLVPKVNTAVFLLTILAVILYLIMYILMYLSFIKLRFSKKEVYRSYMVPGGKIGMWIIAMLGIIGAIFAIIIGFFPPAVLQVKNPIFYVSFLIVGIVIILAIPIIITHCKNPKWKPRR